jgi:hypothetical protein
MSSIHPFIARLAVLERELRPSNAKNDPNAPPEKPLDAFTRSKRDIAAQIRDIRESIEEREQARGETGESSPAVIQLSAQIRTKIAAARASAQDLDRVTRAKDKDKKKRKPEEEEELTHQKESVDLIFKHLDEVDKLEKRRFQKKESAARTELFKGFTPRSPTSSNASSPSGGGVGGGGGGGGRDKADRIVPESTLPDIDVEAGLQKWAERDQQMDVMLTQIGQGVSVLKDMATEMGQELDKQAIMIEEIEAKVIKADVSLKVLDKRLSQALSKTPTSEKACVYIILLVVVLGLGFLLYNMTRNVQKNGKP